MGRLIHRETQAGMPITHRGLIITPFVETIRVQPPRYRGVVLWQRPTSIVVREPNGETSVLQVEDVTRNTLIRLFAFSLAVFTGFLTFALMKRFQNSD
jgi:hypothetical protein